MDKIENQKWEFITCPFYKTYTELKIKNGNFTKTEKIYN